MNASPTNSTMLIYQFVKMLKNLTNNSLGIIFKLVMYKIVEKQAEILEIVNSGNR